MMETIRTFDLLEEYEYILNQAAPKFIFVSDKNLYEKIKPIADRSGKVQDIYSFNEVPGARHFSEILKMGKESALKLQDELEIIKVGIESSDVATIIYTSGTTGFPKGAMLRYSNLISNCIETTYVHPLGNGAKELSFLPLSYILELMMTYLYYRVNHYISFDHEKNRN